MTHDFEFEFEDSKIPAHAGESVLDALLRAGHEISSVCRAGVCQSCLLRAEGGTVAPVAQKGLRKLQITTGQFLACQCPAAADLRIERGEKQPEWQAQVAEVEQLPGQVLRVVLQTDVQMSWRAGQFIHLLRDDGLTRAYSIANLPGESRLEMHVALIPKGKMSGWLKDAVGKKVTLRGPLGECCYNVDDLCCPLLLTGTSTGLSPLLGIVRDAINQGHTGPIHLIWGATHSSKLYLLEELRALCASHANLHLTCSALTNDLAHPGVLETPLEELFLGGDRPWKDLEIYLCGNEDLVARLKKKAYLAGASLSHIHADPFLAAK